MPARWTSYKSNMRRQPTGGANWIRRNNNGLMVIPEGEMCHFEVNLADYSSLSGADRESSTEETFPTKPQHGDPTHEKVSRGPDESVLPPSSSSSSPTSLPSSSASASKHGIVCVNNDRELRGLHALRQSRHLDALARHHAKEMAREGRVVHSVDNVEELQSMLKRDHVGENVQRGVVSIQEMHRAAMDKPEEEEELATHSSSYRQNVSSSLFQEFGMGIAKGEDGNVYMCQYFRSGSE